MLKNDLNYHLFVCIDEDKVIGISFLYTFMSLGIGLLDYMTVITKYRNAGVGSKLFDYTLENFTSSVKNGVGLLMEIQNEKGHDRKESATRRRRIDFYLRLGAKILDRVNYLLPPLQDGAEPEEMLLMIRPLVELTYLTRESVIQYIQAIYTRIYQYAGYDLLDRTIPKTS